MADVVRIGDCALYHGDCLDILPMLPPAHVSMVLCDLPYGMTDNSWDVRLPLDVLWPALHRVCTGAIVLTAIQPYTSLLVCSNLSNFKHDWVWHSAMPSNFFNSKKRPLKDKEDILVFAKNKYNYNPQMVYDPRHVGQRGEIMKTKSSNYRNGKETTCIRRESAMRYPRQLLSFTRPKNTAHSTQKPVDLLQYLIRTYSNPGDVILDCCMGSGTTGLAAASVGRGFIGIEKNSVFYATARTAIMSNKLPIKPVDETDTWLVSGLWAIPDEEK